MRNSDVLLTFTLYYCEERLLQLSLSKHNTHPCKNLVFIGSTVLFCFFKQLHTLISLCCNFHVGLWYETDAGQGRLKAERLDLCHTVFSSSWGKGKKLLLQIGKCFFAFSLPWMLHLKLKQDGKSWGIFKKGTISCSILSACRKTWPNNELKNELITAVRNLALFLAYCMWF